METDLFIISRDFIDSYEHHSLLYYGRSSELGVVRILIDNFKPYFFVKRGVEVPYNSDREEVDLYYEGKLVDKIYFRNQRSLIASSRQLRDRGEDVYEDDIRPEDRFLMDRGIYSSIHLNGDCFEKDNVFYFKDPEVTPCYYLPDLSMISLDIENNPWKNILYSVGLHYKYKNIEDHIVFVLSPEERQVSDRVIYLSSEEDLLLATFHWIKCHDPDIITGWNVAGFDLNFLHRKCEELKIPFDLSRYRKQTRLTQRRRNEFFASIPGRIVLDGPTSLRSCFMKYESYSLESVAREVLGVGKLIGPGKDRGKEVETLFLEDKEKLAAYNLRDCTLVTEIIEKTNLLEIILIRSLLTGLGPEYVGMTTAAFDHFMLPKYHKHKLVSPAAEDIVKPRRNKGAYVLKPKTGLYKNVIGLDFKSLYPSVIRTFKIDPIALKKNMIDPIETPSGISYSRTEHELPDRFAFLTNLRDRAKKEGNLPLSKALKILMNGFYGVMGSDGCRFFSQQLAEGIVSNANWILTETQKYLEDQGYRVLYGDTDSLFVELKHGESSKDGYKIIHLINDYWSQRLGLEYNLESHLEIEYEKFFEKFLLPKSKGGRAESAKKRYAGLIVEQNKKFLHFTGMESVRSDWTQLAKDFQHGLYSRVFQEEDYIGWIQEFIWNLLCGKMDHLLIYTKRIKRVLSNYKVSPPQVRAARMLQRPVSVVSYIFTTEGPVPIQLDHGPIDYQHYIDKQIKPITNSILGIIGGSLEEVLGY